MVKKEEKKKRTIKKRLANYFIIAVALVIIGSFVGFKLFVDQQALEKLVEFDIENKASPKEILGIIRRCLVIIFLNTIVISFAIIKIVDENVLNPIKKITEATKKVSVGDFNIKLESKRDDEIGELTQNFNQMVKDLGSTEKLQKEFIDNVSHEIKTPISSIQGFAKMLKDGNISDEERAEYSQIIIDESNRLLNLSNNMLKLSKLQNQSKILNKENINITEQIRKTISVLDAKWTEKEIVFDINMEEKYLFGDEELLFQVWMNLIDNSIKFSHNKGKIKISLYEEDDNIAVKIKDNGVGMDEEECQKVFTRFYQVDKSHSEQGFGLGLPIVKRIVELSNGTIEITSKLKHGTTVTVKFPIEKENDKVVVV